VRAFTSHPVARCAPGLPRQRWAGRFELSPAWLLAGCPAPDPADEKDASHRLLQPTSNTSTRCLLPDSRARPSSLAAFQLAPDHQPNPAETCASADCAADPAGGASLDGEPPASVTLQPWRWLVRCRSAERAPTSSMCGPGRAFDRCSSAPCLSRPALSAKLRACNLTSGALVATTSPSPTLRSSLGGWPPDFTLTTRSSKTGGLVETRTPSLDEYSLAAP
jgi:hypothetical protein